MAYILLDFLSSKLYTCRYMYMYIGKDEFVYTCSQAPSLFSFFPVWLPTFNPLARMSFLSLSLSSQGCSVDHVGDFCALCGSGKVLCN